MSRIRLLGLTLIAACVVSAASASVSLAGNNWYAEGHRMEAGETFETTGSNTEHEAVGVFKLQTSPDEVECTKLLDKATLKGGNPGTDKDLITLTECSVTEHPGCTVASEGSTSGTVVLKANSELVYRSPSAAEKEEVAEGTIADLMIGEGTGESFAKVIFTGGKSCALSGTMTLHGTTAAKLKPPGEAGEWDLLEFPAPSVKTVYRGKAGIEQKLKLAFETQLVIALGKEWLRL